MFMGPEGDAWSEARLMEAPMDMPALSSGEGELGYVIRTLSH
jgi:hypothetical protein